MSDWNNLCSACKGYEIQEHTYDDSCFERPLRKVCASCETIAEPHEKNAYGDLGGWANTAIGWFCPDCPVRR